MDILHVAVDYAGRKGQIHLARKLTLLIQELNGHAARSVLEIFNVHLPRKINLLFPQ